MEYFFLLLLGSVTGFLSSFFGIGGGSLIVPMLYILYPSFPPSVVIPISLGTIFFVAVNNTIRFKKLDLTPQKSSFIIFGITCTIGALLGSLVTFIINRQQAKYIIGGLLFLIVAKLFLSKKKNPSCSHLTFAFHDQKIVKLQPYRLVGE